MITPATRIPTGIPSLNKLLGGGFYKAAINLIYGEATTGKTTLSLTTVFHHLKQNKRAKAIYLDIDNKLNTARLQRVAQFQGPYLLKRIHLYTPESYRNQGDAFEQLPTLSRDDLLVVDTITGLYRGETEDSEKTFAVNKELNRQLGYLMEIAKTTGATLLLIGQVRSILDTNQVEPVAQRLLRYWSNTIIRLEKTRNPENRQATLEKPIGNFTPIIITIDETGITEEKK
ncbi:ATPase domain-containing protein [Thermoproteota archaeon]